MARVALVSTTAILAAVPLAGCGESQPDRSSVAGRVEAQLRYLEPESSVVAAVDLRFDGSNWEEIRPLISRMLRAWRERQAPEDRLEVPVNAEGALAMLASFGGLDFDDDVRPALDGHLVLGAVQPPRQPSPRQEAGPRMVLVYRTEDGDLRRIAEALTDGGRLRSLEGHDDVGLLDDWTAIVGDDTLLLVGGSGRPKQALAAALERADDDRGFPVEQLAEAERDAGSDDPLVLARGDLALAGVLLERAQLDRLRESVPFAAALDRAALVVEVSEDDGFTATATLTTDARELADEELPVGPAGPLALPSDDTAIVGASRNQSRTTTLLARAARTTYPDSRFARAVTRAERALGIHFEQELLRQFDCPSVSVLVPPGAQPARFAARSCVRDPDRLSRLLPRLRPHLPAIVRGLQGLGDRGLAGLLLVAPDAPLTPSALAGLAQVDVRPLGGDDEEDNSRDELYEIAGLHENTRSATALAGPPRVVFGLLGDVFVVASDESRAHEIADAETHELADEAGAAIVAPLDVLLQLGRGPEAEAVTEVLPRAEITFSATPQQTTIRARVPVAEE